MKKEHKSESISLRQKAEELMKTKSSKSGSQLSGSDTMKLIHELEVHQIELEMQNEELMLARSAAREDAEKYTELYDFAPSGYFTLSKECKILDINLFGSQMLGKERSKLKNCRFDVFISDDTKSIFSLFFEKVFESKTKETCEVALSAEGKLLTYVILSGIIDKNPEYCMLTAIDITERKQAEVELYLKEQRYRSFIDSTSDYVFLKDEQFKHLVANKSYCEAFNKTEKEFIGKTDFEQMYEPYAINCQASDLKAISLNKVVMAEEKWDDKTFETIKFPVEYQKGKIGVGGFVRDITERKKTEEKLKESISLYKLLSENVRDVVWLMDFDLRTTFISPSIVKLRGYTFEELEQMSVEQNLTPGSFKLAMTVFSEEMDKLKADAKLSLNRTIDLQFYCKDGSTVWLENTFTIIRDENGSPVSILGEGRDITERRNSQESLVKLQRAIDASSEVVFITDNQGVFTFINPAFTTIYGYTPEDVIGKVTPRILSSRTVEKEYYEWFWKEISGGKEVRGEWINKTKECKVINIEGTSTPIIVD